MHSHGKLFVAWGGNYNLAKVVAEELRKAGFDPQVGGDLNPSAADFFLGNQVLTQIAEASRALVLMQWPPEGDKLRGTGPLTSSTLSPDHSEPLYRPNIMFEFGYLTARLQPADVHVFLIGIKRTSLPSDLMGIRAEEIELGDIETMARKITQRSQELMISARVAPVELFRNWDAWFHFIERQVHKDDALDARLASVLVHSIQPAFYMGCSHKLAQLARSIDPQSASTAVSAAQRLVAGTDVYNQAASREEDFSDTSLVALKGLRRMLEVPFDASLAENEDYPWFEVVRTDYLALCHYQIGIAGRPPALDRSSGDGSLRSALNAITAAEDALDKIVVRDAVHHLWKGYIKRNAGRIHTALGEREKAAEALKQAIEARVLAFAELSSLHIPKPIHDQLDMEVQLADLDLLDAPDTRLPGSATPKARQLIRDAIETIRLRREESIGLWARAQALVKRVAKYHDMSEEAEKL